LFPRIRGRHAYRCRSCRARFYGAGAAASRSRFREFWRRRHGAGRGSRRLRRRLLEAVVFFLMLVVFYVLLRFLILTIETAPSKESGSAPHFDAITMA
jgi:hypothetical protein